MLDGIRQKLKDRRGKYSLRGHVSRLRREGRLPQIGLAAVAVLTVGGIAFARCEASSITGPSDGGARMSSAPSTNTVASGGSVGTSNVGTETFREHTHNRDFVFSGMNPCNGDMVKAFGKRHDRVRIVASPTSFAVDHHINDSFRGEAVEDPAQAYTGSDIHNDRFEIGIDGMEHREITNEHLIAQGPAPNWILHVNQKSDFSFDDPLNPKVGVQAHASCPPESKCTRSGGCPDQPLSLISVAP